MDRFECREKLVEELAELKILEKIEERDNTLGVCYRCKNIIEPMLSEQWFVKMEDLAKNCLNIINDNKIKFIPESQILNLNSWLKKIKDWCISRQIWWGHQLPIWECKNKIENKDGSHNICGNIICTEAEETDVTICTKCGSDKIVRSTEVLDTWFSSALWAFSVFDKEEDFKYYYPTSLLVTAYDI